MRSGMGSFLATPGYFYAVSYWLTCALTIWSGPVRRSRRWRIGYLAVYLALLCVVMTLSQGTVRLFIPLMLLYAASIFAGIHVNTRYDVRTSVFFAVRAFITAELVASCAWLAVFTAVSLTHLPFSGVLRLGALLLSGGLCVLLFVLLERRNRELNAELSVSRREMLGVVIIALAVFVASDVSFALPAAEVTLPYVREILLTRTLVDLGGVAIIYATQVQLAELKARLEVGQLQGMLAMQYNNYEVLRQNIDTINQKYHDLKYQIALLKSGAGSGEALEGLERMEQDIRSYEAQNKTGNAVLDTILTAKSLYAQQHWIELTCVADGAELSFMSPMDLSSMFGNILDNAIEAVEKIEHKERRLIHLTVAREKGFLRIREENPYEVEPVQRNGNFVTSKSDAGNHGFGIRSIRSTAAKYGGSVTIRTEDGWFEMRILIPVPEGAGRSGKSAGAQ